MVEPPYSTAIRRQGSIEDLCSSDQDEARKLIKPTWERLKTIKGLVENYEAANPNSLHYRFTVPRFAPPYYSPSELPPAIIKQLFEREEIKLTRHWDITLFLCTPNREIIYTVKMDITALKNTLAGKITFYAEELEKPRPNTQVRQASFRNKSTAETVI